MASFDSETLCGYASLVYAAGGWTDEVDEILDQAILEIIEEHERG